MNASKPFIQSVYCCRVFTPASGSACAEKVASGLQYALHPSHPFPVSQASKNFLAIPVIGVMGLSPRESATLSRLVAFPYRRAMTVVTLTWSGHPPVSTFDGLSPPPCRVYAEGTNAVDQPDLRPRPDPGRGPPPPRKSGP